MSEVVEVPCRSREASKPAWTCVHTAVIVATVSEKRPHRWEAR